jgi:hypothetical protein
VRTDAVDGGDGFVAGRRNLATFDHEFAGLGQTEERHRVRHAGGCDTGKSLEMFQRETLERRDFFAARVGGGREEHGGGDKMVGFPAAAAVVQFVEPADKEPGACEQDHREGELTDDEAVPEASMAAIAHYAARAVLEGLDRVEPEGEERGDEGEGQGRDDRGGERPAEHAPVEGEDDAVVAIPGADNRDPVVEPQSDENGADAAGEGQQQGLDDQGTQQLGGRGTEGGTHGELACAGHRAGELEIREIGAGDEQHETGEADQHAENDRAVFAGHEGLEREGAPGAFGVGGGKIRGEAATEVGDEGVGLRVREGAGATPHETNPSGSAIRDFLVGQAEWPEKIERTQMAPVVDGRGQHADDFVGFAVDANDATNDVGVASEAVLPTAVADQEDPVIAQEGFIGMEVAAELRLGAEDGKEIGGDAEAEDHLGGFARFGEAQAQNAVGGNFAVAIHLGLQREVVGRRKTAPRVLGGGAINAIQMIALRVGQRSQQNTIEDAEHRDVGPDAERERDDRDDGEPGRFRELAESVTEVGQHKSTERLSVLQGQCQT